MVCLLNDPNLYKDLFGTIKTNEDKPIQHSIDYHMDYLLTNGKEPDIFKLIKYLSNTSNMALFRSGYIQRMINF